jgi:hypothetical protein
MAAFGYTGKDGIFLHILSNEGVALPPVLDLSAPVRWTGSRGKVSLLNNE